MRVRAREHPHRQRVRRPPVLRRPRTGARARWRGVPGRAGLVGHSDADVITHAVSEALLGAAGLGDLGRALPRLRPDVGGRRFAPAAGRGGADGRRPTAGSAVNVDCSVVAERPKLAARRDEMQFALVGGRRRTRDHQGSACRGTRGARAGRRRGLLRVGAHRTHRRIGHEPAARFRWAWRSTFVSRWFARWRSWRDHRWAARRGGRQGRQGVEGCQGTEGCEGRLPEGQVRRAEPEIGAVVDRTHSHRAQSRSRQEPSRTRAPVRRSSAWGRQVEGPARSGTVHRAEGAGPRRHPGRGPSGGAGAAVGRDAQDVRDPAERRGRSVRHRRRHRRPRGRAAGAGHRGESRADWTRSPGPMLPRGWWPRPAELPDVTLDPCCRSPAELTASGRRSRRSCWRSTVSPIPETWVPCCGSVSAPASPVSCCPEHRAVHVTPTVTKAAAGAVEYLPMSLVGGLPTAIEEMKRAGVWVVGLDMDGDTSVHDLTVSDRGGLPGARRRGQGTVAPGPPALRPRGVDPAPRSARHR